MMKKFREIVRDGEVKSPVQKGFKISAWANAWEHCLQDEDGRMLHEAGLAFYDVLNDIRSSLTEWYTQHAPKVSCENLLRYYCAIPNRDRFLAGELARTKGHAKKNIFSRTTANNVAENELSLQEISEGTVDGIQKAVLAGVNNLAKNVILPEGLQPLDLIQFIKGEANFSQLYGIYEGYWNALLWGDYEFQWVDKTCNFASISQKFSNSEVAFEISQVRRARLSANSLNEAVPYYLQFNDKYVFLQGQGRNKKYCVSNIRKATDEVRFLSCVFHLNVAKLCESLPSSFLEKTYLNINATIFEMLEVFRVLVLLSIHLMGKFPKNDEIRNAVDLFAFAPSLNFKRLVTSIAAATDFSEAKVESILNFLKYRSQENDLWCHPIVDLKNGHVVLLTSALCSPVVLRVVEHWLVSLDVNLTEKGYVYEGNVLNEINNALTKNEFAKDYDEARAKRVKLANGEEEEIDLFLRIGSTILVGEAKSIISTDSPISYYRARRVLEGAAAQALRKTDFVKRNASAVFKSFGIQWYEGREYKFVPVIINSNKMHVGFPIGGVPVVDELIMSAYFNKRIFPLLSTVESGIAKHLAWFEVYNNAETFEKNLELYLNSPPQVSEKPEVFELKSTFIPSIKKGSLFLRYSRLLPKDISLDERLKANYSFELFTVPNIEGEVSEIELVI